MDKCDCWYEQMKQVYTYDRFTGVCDGVYSKPVGVCYGTKEKEECQCMGDRGKCDFYPEVREKAKKLDEVNSALKEQIAKNDRLQKMYEDAIVRTKEAEKFTQDRIVRIVKLIGKNSDLIEENRVLKEKLEEMTNRNDENSGMCKIWEKRFIDLQTELTADKAENKCILKNSVSHE